MIVNSRVISYVICQIFYMFILCCCFIFKFIFNWRITAWQYCVGLRYTLPCISHRYTYVPSLLNFPPISHPLGCLFISFKHYPLTSLVLVSKQSVTRIPISCLWKGTQSFSNTPKALSACYQVEAVFLSTYCIHFIFQLF